MNKLGQMQTVHRQQSVGEGEIGTGPMSGGIRRTTRGSAQQIDMTEVRKTRDPVFVLSSYVQKRGEALEFMRKRGTDLT